MSDSVFDTSGFDRQVESLQRELNGFKQSIQNRIMRQALRKGLSVMNKAIRAQIPPDKKQIKRLIGHRMLRMAGGDKIAGKVGVAVGRKTKIVASREGRSGVGISANNVHWFVLGTAARAQKSGKSTGVMPPQVPGAVKRGIESSYRRALQVMADATRKGIEKEAAKIADKIRAAR